MFYGWRVVSGTVASQMLVAGFFTYAISFFIQPVKSDFGVSLEQVMYSFTLGSVFGIFIMPLCGLMLDRFSARLLMCSGTLLYGGCLWWLSFVDSITAYIIIFAFAFTISQSLGGPLASATVISRWFTKSRGKALGISASGVSLGGVVMPPLISGWIEDYGWRQAMEYSAMISLFIILPLLYLSIRGRPSDVSLEPEPQTEAGNDSSPQTSERALSIKDIISQSAFWYIGIGFGAVFAAYVAFIPNLTSYALDLGVSSSRASNLIMVLASCALLGKLLFGTAADKLNPKGLLWSVQALVLLAFMLLASKPGLVVLFLAYAILGLATGGMIPLLGAMIAKVFGVKSYGRATGILTTLINICALPAFLVIGRLYDSTGDYTLSFMIFSGIVVFAALFIAPLKVRNIAEIEHHDTGTQLQTAK